jgi:signal transduction histidine kinase
MARHVRTAKRQKIPNVGGRRLLPFRVVLLILAFVPSAAMVTLLAVNSSQLYSDWHTATTRENAALSSSGAFPAITLFYDLQQERKFSEAALADPSAYKPALAQVRKLTDTSASTLEGLSGLTSPSVVASLQQFETQLRQLSGYRTAVDDGAETQQQAFDDYSALTSSNLELFTAVTQTGIATIDVITAPSIPTGWGQEMISREDAIVTAGAASGHLDVAQRAQIAKTVGAEQFIYQDEVIPGFPAAAGLYQGMLDSKAWQEKTQVELSLADTPASSSGAVAMPPALGQEWQQAMSALTPELQHLTVVGTGDVVSAANSEVSSLKTHLIVETALGAAGVVLVIGFTWWLIILLRRRIFALRLAAQELETKLPDVVERLRSGQAVDTDAELPALQYGRDELGMLGQALNAARASALETSVRQVEQYRGFERLLQRIARRTQLLIGLQMKRLSEMERQHEDAAVLEGLFDLDHLAARLRRYEENLVILGGGQTQRRWRKPVPLLNVLRSAQSEVQDYRRIKIETESRVWISERAVGALVHVLAELMENAVAFSKPPAPVEVTATQVAHGLAIEIEDRGMGLDAEQYAQANAMMVNPPRMDVLSRADDARLGLYVVARLAAKLDVKVELRPSAYGGTRVVVLVPAELVLSADQAPASGEGEDDFDLVPRLSVVADDSDIPAAAGYVLNGVFRGVGESNGNGRPDESDRLLAGVGGRSADSAAEPALDPLPKRVRQASLAAELRESRGGGGGALPHDDSDAEPDRRASGPGRSAATVGAFQRQSRLARLAEDGEPPLTRPSSDTEQTREED